MQNFSCNTDGLIRAKGAAESTWQLPRYHTNQAAMTNLLLLCWRLFVLENIVTILHRGPEGAKAQNSGLMKTEGGGKGVQNQRNMSMGKIEREFVSTVYLVCGCVCVRRSVRLNRRGFL